MDILTLFSNIKCVTKARNHHSYLPSPFLHNHARAPIWKPFSKHTNISLMLTHFSRRVKRRSATTLPPIRTAVPFPRKTTQYWYRKACIQMVPHLTACATVVAPPTVWTTSCTRHWYALRSWTISCPQFWSALRSGTWLGHQNQPVDVSHMIM